MAALAAAGFCTTARIAACRISLRSSATQRVRARWVVVQVRMASGGGGSSGSGGGNRAVIWFRGTDLRVHDNVVVHEAARRVQAGTVSEVGARECGAHVVRGNATAGPYLLLCSACAHVHAWHVQAESDMPDGPAVPHMPWVQVLPLYCFDPRFFSTSACELQGRPVIAHLLACHVLPTLRCLPGQQPFACQAPLTAAHSFPHAGGNPKTGAFRAQFLLESVLDLKRQLRALGSDLVIAMGRPEEVGGWAWAAVVTCFAESLAQGGSHACSTWHATWALEPLQQMCVCIMCGLAATSLPCFRRSSSAPLRRFCRG